MSGNNGGKRPGGPPASGHQLCSEYNTLYLYVKIQWFEDARHRIDMAVLSSGTLALSMLNPVNDYGINLIPLGKMNSLCSVS